MKKYFFELVELCFGEDMICNEEEEDRFIQELVSGSFHCSDSEECDSINNEVRICLHHMEGPDDKYMGYFWLKFRINQRPCDDK